MTKKFFGQLLITGGNRLVNSNRSDQFADSFSNYSCTGTMEKMVVPK
ncbi:hypothetical protein [uncultured Rubinisphaera sp.]